MLMDSEVEQYVRQFVTLDETITKCSKTKIINQIKSEIRRIESLETTTLKFENYLNELYKARSNFFKAFKKHDYPEFWI